MAAARLTSCAPVSERRTQQVLRSSLCEPGTVGASWFRPSPWKASLAPPASVAGRSAQVLGWSLKRRLMEAASASSNAENALKYIASTVVRPQTGNSTSGTMKDAA